MLNLKKTKTCETENSRKASQQHTRITPNDTMQALLHPVKDRVSRKRSFIQYADSLSTTLLNMFKIQTTTFEQVV